MNGSIEERLHRRTAPSKNGSIETCRLSAQRSGAKTNDWEYPLGEAAWIVSCG
jgi:hypothetical protein